MNHVRGITIHPAHVQFQSHGVADMQYHPTASTPIPPITPSIMAHCPRITARSLTNNASDLHSPAPTPASYAAPASSAPNTRGLPRIIFVTV